MPAPPNRRRLRFLARPAHALDDSDQAAWLDEGMAVLEHADFAPLGAGELVL